MRLASGYFARFVSARVRLVAGLQGLHGSTVGRRVGHSRGITGLNYTGETKQVGSGRGEGQPPRRGVEGRPRGGALAARLTRPRGNAAAGARELTL